MDSKAIKAKISFKKYILSTLYEYLLIILPVFIYVSLECMHKGVDYFIKSPEWAIASIFLSFQAIALYIRNLYKENLKLNNDFIGILLLLIIIITISATLNAYASLFEDQNTTFKIALRLFLLLISSFSFFILVIASKIKNN